MSVWKTKITMCDQTLGDAEIRRGIFQGNRLSPLTFVFSMIPLYSLLRETLKVSKYGVFSGPYFLVFGLNTEIYGVNLDTFHTMKGNWLHY